MSDKGKKITICSVGDLMICDSPLYASVGVRSKYSEIREKIFSNCKAVFDDADIVIGNFETVVHSPKNKGLKEIQMCCSESVVEDLRKAGFSILNIANNHCMQHGTAEFNNTKDTCEKYGIKPIGIRDEKPYIKVIDGVKLAFLSLCIHLEWYEPNRILYEDRIERIIKDVKNLREKNTDMIIIVSVHWGDEFATYPSNAQIALAHKLVDYGANVILGHHSHVYQGIEEYKYAVIVYGQGNFVSDMVPEMCRQTGIVRIVIDAWGCYPCVSYELVQYYISDDFVPVPAEGDWFEARQAKLYEILTGNTSDEKYWSAIRRNRNQAHRGFTSYFKKNIGKYRLQVSIKMLLEFIGRKMKRMIGTSTDGQISSMDPNIYRVLKKLSNTKSENRF